MVEEKKKENTEEHHEHHEKKNSDLVKFVKTNPWMLSTAVLAVLAIILLVFVVIGGSSISEKAAGTKLTAFLNTMVGGGVEYVDAVNLGSVYQVNVVYQGQEVPVYITKDGKYFVQAVTPINTSTKDDSSTPTTDVPKTDKPVVELFVMSYCPYGTQAEKGILPVVALLGNKIDFKLRFVHYTLHGAKEDLENAREACIRDEQSQSVLNKYLVCILNSTDASNPYNPAACEAVAGVDSAKLKTCISANRSASYIGFDATLSEGYGVQGSPTLIINGVQSSAGRSPQSYLDGICDAFTDAPAECSQKLSSSSPSAGFGYNAGSDTVAQCG